MVFSVKISRWAAALVILLAVSTVAPAQTYRDQIEKRFDVRSGGLLDLDTDIGSIRVTTHNAERMEVQITREVRSSSEKAAREFLDEIEMDFQQRDGDVVIRVDVPEKDWLRIFGRRRRLRLRYEITVPRNYNLALRTSGGSVEVSDLRGSIEARTSGGSLRFEKIDGDITGKTSGGSITLLDCDGRIQVKTSGGSLRLEEISGDVDARTSGGSIHVERVRGNVNVSTSGGSIRVVELYGSIRGKTSGGTIRVDLAEQPQADCRLTTSGGSIYVYAAENMAFDLDASTSGGSITSDLPVTVKGKISKRSIRGKVNGGGPLLYLHTSGGSIHLKQK